MTEIISREELPKFTEDDFNKLVVKSNTEGKFSVKIGAHRISQELIEKISKAGYFIFTEDDAILTTSYGKVYSYRTHFINW